MRVHLGHLKGSQFPGNACQPPSLAPLIHKASQARLPPGKSEGMRRGEGFESAKDIIGVIKLKTLVYMIFQDFPAEGSLKKMILNIVQKWLQPIQAPPFPSTPPT